MGNSMFGWRCTVRMLILKAWCWTHVCNMYVCNCILYIHDTYDNNSSSSSRASGHLVFADNTKQLQLIVQTICINYQEARVLMNNKTEMNLDDLQEALLENEVTNFDPVAEAFKVGVGPCFENKRVSNVHVVQHVKVYIYCIVIGVCCFDYFLRPCGGLLGCILRFFTREGRERFSFPPVLLCLYLPWNTLLYCRHRILCRPHRNTLQMIGWC